MKCPCCNNTATALYVSAFGSDLICGWCRMQEESVCAINSLKLTFSPIGEKVNDGRDEYIKHEKVKDI